MKSFLDKMFESYLYKQSFLAFLLKALGALMAFMFNILLSRKLGAENTGIFFLCFTVILIAVVLGRLGLDNVVLREIAKYKLSNKLGELKGIFLYSVKIVIITSALLGLLIFFTSDLISDKIFNIPEMANPLRLMSLIVVPYSLVFIIAAALKGLKKISQATIIESLLIPSFSVSFLFFFVPDNNLEQFLNYYVVTLLATLLIAIYYWKRYTIFIKENASVFSIAKILDSSVPLLWVASLLFINSWADRIFLGIYSNPESVGVYSIAMKIAMLVSFVLIAVNSASSSKFSEFYQSKSIKELSNYCTKSTNLMMLISSPILLLLVLFSNHILSVFGSEFIIGSTVVIILCFGQFINVATGSVGQILAMTNRERLLRKSILIGMFTNILLNFLLVPKYGINGAAIATSFSWTISNIFAFYYVRMEFHFNACFMGKYLK